MARSFTPEEEAFIEKIAFKVMDIFEKRHIQSCPWGKKIVKYANQLFNTIGR